jgi:triosephosphate isomerase
MRTPLIAGNWKLNKTIAEAEALLAELVPLLDALQSVETLVCPPFVSLSAAAAALRGSRVRLGAQNLYWEDSGAFTGEVSAPMLAGLCQYVIIGHSERRAYFGETDESVNQKARAALAHGLTPIVCVGEVLAEREAGREAGVVGGQLHAGLAGLPVTSSEHLVIAYEPVWAIGTGKAATVEDAVAMNRDVIRPALAGLFSDELAQAIRIQYGGSVKADNAAELMSQPDVDGALVGGASLKAADFVAIVKGALR